MFLLPSLARIGRHHLRVHCNLAFRICFAIDVGSLQLIFCLNQLPLLIGVCCRQMAIWQNLHRKCSYGQCGLCFATQTFKMDKSTLAKAFKMWDHANQGFVKPAHLRHLLNDRGLPPGITEADITEMIEHADQDGDGKIQWDE